MTPHVVYHHIIYFNLLSEWHHKLIFLIINIFLTNWVVDRGRTAPDHVVNQKLVHIIIDQNHGSAGLTIRPVPRIPGQHSLFDRGRTCLVSIVIVHITILCHKGTVT